ncbi:MAG: hypothetical protein JRJ02_11915 [Deltaproteobacteria bacterium]|nr:hypothetical protein [Deltaproteobacteria bacterium]MBW1863061.1 hypothetical protein [Deltaproteobacteria bacterium]
MIDGAIDEFNKAILSDPRAGEAYSWRWYVYYEKGQYNRAVSDYDKAIESIKMMLFVKDVIADAEEKAKETLRLALKISDLPSLAREVCEGKV